MQLQSLDILVTINDRNDPFSRFKRWMMGPYDHVGLYLGMMGMGASRPYYSGDTPPENIEFPAVFESVGRGILIRDLRSWTGRKVAVMRILVPDIVEYHRAIYAQAIGLASMYGSYYDYPAIIRWAIPRIILQKLGLPVPQTWQRDERHICSEAVYSVIEKSGLDILPDTQVPLPGDFIESYRLHEADRGYIGFHPKIADGKAPLVYVSPGE